MRVVETTRAPAAIGPYSQAVKAGDFLYCSGQVPLVGQTQELVEGGVAEQTQQVLDNLEAVLKAAEVDFSAVVKTTIYLTDMQNFAEVNEIYGRRFSGYPPARATVAVAGLPKDALVEIDAIAYLGR